MSAVKLELKLPVSLEAPAKARHSLDRLAGNVAPEVLDKVRLLVSELVTNSVRHADLGPNDWVTLEVETQMGGVRVEVTDPGPGFERQTVVHDPHRTSGWGLYLVDQLSDDWGFNRRPAAASVWFKIRC